MEAYLIENIALLAGFAALFVYSWALSQVVSSFLAFIEPGKGWIFSFWGEFMERAAAWLEKNGHSAFWLKPLGLCHVCTGIWAGIAGAVLFWHITGFYLPFCLIMCVSAVWKWSFL